MGVSESEKSSIASSFVKQYYTLLNKAPCFIHNFYSHDSTFIHGSIEMAREHYTEPVVGREKIKRKMEDLKLNDCRAKIKQIDCLETLASGLVIQVIGELSNDGKPMRRFLQTFVLAPTPEKSRHDGDQQNVKTTPADKKEIGFFVLNSIFRYQDDGPDSEFEDDVASVNANISNESTENGKSVPEKSPASAPSVNTTSHAVAVTPTVPPMQPNSSNEPTENGKAGSEDPPAAASSTMTTSQTVTVAPTATSTRQTPLNEPKTWANMVRKAHPPSTSVQASVSKPVSSGEQQGQSTNQLAPVQTQQSPQQQQQQHQSQMQQQPQQQGSQVNINNNNNSNTNNNTNNNNSNNPNNRRRYITRNKPNKPSGRQIKNRPRPAVTEKPVV